MRDVDWHRDRPYERGEPHTGADVYFGHRERILDIRKENKRKAIENRHRQHFKAAA
jgi:hypothetical protein